MVDDNYCDLGGTYELLKGMKYYSQEASSYLGG